MLTYVVDAHDRVVDISGPWDTFSAGNAAPALTRDRVLGTPLLDHVSGPEVRELTRMLVARARRGAVRDLDFRCDAPAERRYLRMALEPEPGGAVRCETTLVRAEHRPWRQLLDTAAARSEEVLVACSWCRKILLPDRGFVEVDEAVDAMGLFLDAPVPRLSHGICRPCRGTMMGDRIRA